jgi:hypothetical protein
VYAGIFVAPGLGANLRRPSTLPPCSGVESWSSCPYCVPRWRAQRVTARLCMLVSLSLWGPDPAHVRDRPSLLYYSFPLPQLMPSAGCRHTAVVPLFWGAQSTWSTAPLCTLASLSLRGSEPAYDGPLGSPLALGLSPGRLVLTVSHDGAHSKLQHVSVWWSPCTFGVRSQHAHARDRPSLSCPTMACTPGQSPPRPHTHVLCVTAATGPH